MLPFHSLANQLSCKRYLELLRSDPKLVVQDLAMYEHSLKFAQISDVIRSPHKITPKDFDPAIVLRAHGIDPDRVSFKFGAVHSHGREIMLYDDGVYIGDVGFWKDAVLENKSWYVSLSSGLENIYIGKGLGTLLYLIAGSYTQAEYQSVLASTPTLFQPLQNEWLKHDHSFEAERLWVSLVKNGYAQEIRIPQSPYPQNPFYVPVPEGQTSEHIYYTLNSQKFRELSEKAYAFFLTHLEQ